MEHSATGEGWMGHLPGATLAAMDEYPGPQPGSPEAASPQPETPPTAPPPAAPPYQAWGAPPPGAPYPYPPQPPYVPPQYAPPPRKHRVWPWVLAGCSPVPVSAARGVSGIVVASRNLTGSTDGFSALSGSNVGVVDVDGEIL